MTTLRINNLQNVPCANKISYNYAEILHIDMLVIIYKHLVEGIKK